MLQALYIGATGMFSQQENVDAIANNLANVNTTAFKKSRVNFSDAYYKTATAAGAATTDAGASNAIGMGSWVSSNDKAFIQGALKQTNGLLDVAIQGSGFFEVVMPDGTPAYTRYGSLTINSDGLLATSEGYALKQQIHIPVGVTQTVIDSTGKVSVQMPNENSLTDVGQIDLVSFQNPETLAPLGQGLFVSSQRTGVPTIAKPGEEGLGTLSQGYLESSNVQMAEEMVNLVLAQRAYELNAKVIQTSDEMLSISNNLRR
jgi:flagellar basal-body rod protein FlgG